MKKFMIFFAGVIFTQVIVAQEDAYVSFIEENKSWHYEVSNPNADSEYFSEWLTTYFLDGDTIIGDHRCKRIYVTSSCPFNKREKLYCGALFERDSLVFHVYPNSTEPYLLYDFTRKKGDEVSIYGTTLTILERKTIPYNGRQWLVLTWSPKDFGPCKSLLIEGFGSIDSDILHYYDSWNPGAYHYKLLSCEVNGDEIFNSDSFEGTVDCRGISKDYHSLNANTIYDLSGRKVSSQPSYSLPTREGQGGSLRKGLYIQNGKKVAIK